MRDATAIVHVAPAAGARFTQYTVEFQEGGLLGLTGAECLVYVLEGELEIDGCSLEVDDYFYLPTGRGGTVSAKRAARAVVIERPYQRFVSPPTLDFFVGRERLIEPKPLNGDSSLQVRMLIPDTGRVDFALETMTYQPGGSLPRVEIYAAECSMLMLSGGGVARLGESWHRVTAGDVIWAAPHCPQWFGAFGKTPARHLIYKNWNLFSIAK